MMQLRQNKDFFDQLNTEVVIAGPDDRDRFTDFWKKNDLPFTGIPDPDLRVLSLYGQRFNWLRMGRLPAQFLIDPEGILLKMHYGRGMSDIPDPRRFVSDI